MFRYHAVFPMGQTTWPAGGLIARQRTSEFRAVIWDHTTATWTCSPETAAWFLLDEERKDRTTEVDRARAEQIARELGTSLPSEAELRRICESTPTR